ncbi:uncharacterized protein [Drosophila bipectinata]|uniref:uncharacterized protein n=1 Tax=Drosophila bipectinata TaxID=42026 RepID=UPI0007E6E624|nr:clumping factor A [Drosophila bipectinata]
MAGDAPNSKRDGARSFQLVVVEIGNDQDIEVGVDAALVDNNATSAGGVGGGSSSEPSTSSDTDSDCNEVESNSDTDANANAMVNSGDENCCEFGPHSLKYSLLDGDSDIELDDVELFCEETIALLAHEILCCEGESDSESESESGSESNYLDLGSMQGEQVLQNQGMLDGNLEYGLQNPYQLMLSEEDEDDDAKDNENEGQSSLDNSMTSQTSQTLSGSESE